MTGRIYQHPYDDSDSLNDPYKFNLIHGDYLCYIKYIVTMISNNSMSLQPKFQLSLARNDGEIINMNNYYGTYSVMWSLKGWEHSTILIRMKRQSVKASTVELIIGGTSDKKVETGHRLWNNITIEHDQYTFKFNQIFEKDFKKKMELISMNTTLYNL